MVLTWFAHGWARGQGSKSSFAGQTEEMREERWRGKGDLHESLAWGLQGGGSLFVAKGELQA